MWGGKSGFTWSPKPREKKTNHKSGYRKGWLKETLKLPG